jgi:hypothetical protein
MPPCAIIRIDQQALALPGAPVLWLEVVSPPADRVSGHPEQGKDRADHDRDNANRPDDGDFGDETND